MDCDVFVNVDAGAMNVWQRCSLSCAQGIYRVKSLIAKQIVGRFKRSSAQIKENRSILCERNAHWGQHIQRLATVRAFTGSNSRRSKVQRCTNRLVLSRKREMGDRAAVMPTVLCPRGVFAICVGEQNPTRNLGRLYLPRTIPNGKATE